MIVVDASNNLALQLAFNLQLQPTVFLSNNSYTVNLCYDYFKPWVYSGAC